jgi:hypothetical protein
MHMDEEKFWRIKSSTQIKTLYSLVNRALKARYSFFNIRCARTGSFIPFSNSQVISATDLCQGGVITISSARAHTRKPCKVQVDWHFDESVVIMPSDTPVLGLLSYTNYTDGHSMTDTLLW